MFKLDPAACLRSTFSASIQQIFADQNMFVSNEHSDFTRKSPLSFETTFTAPFRFDGNGYDKLLFKLYLFQDAPAHVQKSALTQRRSHIRSEAYVHLFRTFNDATAQPCLFHDYRLLAVDGSQQQIFGDTKRPDGKPDPYLGRLKNGKKRRFMHINAEYDVLEHTFVDFVVQPGGQLNEDAALIELANRRRETDDHFIITADRGYEALMTFYRFCQNDIRFVIRIKDINSYNTFLKYYDLPDEPVFDIDYDVVLTKKSPRLEDYGKRKFMPQYKKIPEFNEHCDIPLNIRIVRFPIQKQDGEIVYEVLATNLARDEFTPSDLREIYRLRWEIETAFRDLKGPLELGDLVSRKPDLILQELYAKAAVYNLASRIRNVKQRKTKGQKHERELNFKNVILSVWETLFMTEEQLPIGFWDELCRHTVPKRPGRPDTRGK